jgi:uncharacterized C2H2 Zn-finger protein
VEHLVALSQAGGIIVAWKCSGCGEIFLEPTTGSTPEEKGTILIDEFIRHVAKAHQKKTARVDLE